MRKWIKGARLALCLVAYLVWSLGAYRYRDPKKARAYRVKNLQRWTHPILRILGFHIEANRDFFSARMQAPQLLISNHLSYMDVLVIASEIPSVFVTSVEIRDTPFLGLLCKAGGTIFIERRSRSWLVDEMKNIAAVMQDGFNVVLFPEGTTSAGTSVLPFKKSLLGCAQIAGVDIRPLCLNYARANGAPTNSVTADSIFYYGTMDFFPHLLRLLSLRSVEIKLTVLPSLEVNEETSRKALADEAYARITQTYRPVPAAT